MPRLFPFLAAGLFAALAAAPFALAQDSPENPAASPVAVDSELELLPDSLRESVDEAVSQVKPALVRIEVVSTDYRDGREVKYESSGSGVIITPEGHVVTNHHVAGHAVQLLCTLSSKEEISAELIGTDPLTDISVIKLDNEKNTAFPTAAWGDSDAVRVGDSVLAMGSPLALSQSVTLGIVSNTEMIMPRWMSRGGAFSLDGEDVGSFVRWIGHDAAIYGGNSGGPLVNLEGKVIGINEISMSLGGAIPGNLARDVAEELMKSGEVARAWLGIQLQPQLKSKAEGRGVLVSWTPPGSPAEKAGVKAGDLIVRVAGHDVNVRFDEQLPLFNHVIAELPVGEPADLVLIRDGQEQTVQVTPIKREEVMPQEQEFKQWGITARDISFVLARQLSREDQNGALVTTVGTGGPSGNAKPRLNGNDIILKAGGKTISNIEDLRNATSELTEGASDPVPVLVTFERRGQQFITVVEVGIKEIDDPGLEVQKAWLPVETQPLTREIAEKLGTPDLSGFRVTRVLPVQSVKDKIEVGDLITSVDGIKLEANAPEDAEELATLIRQYDIGTEAELEIIRDGETSKVQVELVRSPRGSREMKKYNDESFEFAVRDITFYDKVDEKWEEEQRGVLVEEVKSGGWASLGMLGVGDLILEVNGEKASDVEAMRAIMEKLTADQPDSVVFKVRRGAGTIYLEFDPKWENMELTERT